MKCYRLTLPQFAATSVSGEGSKRAGQRWNSRGVAIAYASSTPEACLLEAMIHVHDDGFPVGWRMLEFDLPDEEIEVLKDLPDGWDEFPYRKNVQAIGDAWVKSARVMALSVPSAIAKSSRNLLLNPGNPKVKELKPRDISDEIDLARIAERLRPRSNE